MSVACERADTAGLRTLWMQLVSVISIGSLCWADTAELCAEQMRPLPVASLWSAGTAGLSTLLLL